MHPSLPQPANNQASLECQAVQPPHANGQQRRSHRGATRVESRRSARSERGCPRWCRRGKISRVRSKGRWGRLCGVRLERVLVLPLCLRLPLLLPLWLPLLLRFRMLVLVPSPLFRHRQAIPLLPLDRDAGRTSSLYLNIVHRTLEGITCLPDHQSQPKLLVAICPLLLMLFSLPSLLSLPSHA